MVAVASVNDNALDAFPVELAGSRAGAVVFAGPHDLGKELILQLPRLLRFALLKELHNHVYYKNELNENIARSIDRIDKQNGLP